MKKSFLLFLSLTFAYILNAQLKVANDGKVYMQRNQTGYNAILGIGDIPDNTPSWYSSYNMGLHLTHYNQQSSTCAIGVFSEAVNSSQQLPSIGMVGLGTGLYNFGVVGAIYPGEDGAGVFGSNEGELPPYHIPDCYAGYFLGDVCVDGDFSTVAIFNTSDIRLKENVVSLSNTERAGESTLNNLLELDVIEYNLKRPDRPTNDSLVQNTRNRNRTTANQINKSDERKHYGVSAQELQLIYPDLVKENKNGYLSVNYVELVPILLRSIQELSTKVTELENAGLNKTRAFDNPDGDIAAPSPTGNVLYQNTPNPFTERTEIRFSLADDALDAYIYIFDMTGKMLRQISVDNTMQSITINAYEFTAGIYLYSLVVGGQEVDTKRMILKN